MYTGAYDEAGALVTQNLPGKITATTVTNELNQPTGLTYTGQITPPCHPTTGT
ncbi:YD repeat-containing protein [Rudaeicoccus suwonensis]|uniref:YD repeat-containing protein n=1 Tax=Rudaeicoccus suwonensis TaxID=657409 RepID=A0A561DVK8_9MICO|nr:YD repeat-containing protein [Rudaeicoccus suwonensis]